MRLIKATQILSIIPKMNKDILTVLPKNSSPLKCYLI